MKQKLHVVKVGGHLVNDNEALHQFLKSFAEIDTPKILVHGGGVHATTIATKLGYSPKMIDGRRITDINMLEVAVMSYAGLSNKKIVALLQELNVDAIGLSGADGNSITAIKRSVNKIDYGFAGDIVSINLNFFKNLLNGDLVPVMNAITHNKKGQLLNTNADTIAAEIAKAMSLYYKVTLFYCFEHVGVLYNVKKPNKIVKILTSIEADKLVAEGVIQKGMMPKIHNGFDAIQNGVEDVIISNFEALTNSNAPKTNLL
jgi:acetylglutamate kinase